MPFLMGPRTVAFKLKRTYDSMKKSTD